jgi:hypothetical protein
VSAGLGKISAVEGVVAVAGWSSRGGGSAFSFSVLSIPLSDPVVSVGEYPSRGQVSQRGEVDPQASEASEQLDSLSIWRVEKGITQGDIKVEVGYIFEWKEAEKLHLSWTDPFSWKTA